MTSSRSQPGADLLSDSPQHTRIKICGICEVEHALAAAEHGADAIGLVFAPRSPRSIAFEVAERILDALPDGVTPVALFTDPNVTELHRWPGRWVQLHGHEDTSAVQRAARTFSVLKGFRYSRQAVQQWDACNDLAGLLVDGSSGGRGKTFDYDELASIRNSLKHPLILAGGLNPENVADAIAQVRPEMVDVSSGVESSRGVKDPALIEQFCLAVRSVV